MIYRSLIRLLGMVIAFLGLTMLLPLAWSLWFGDGQWPAFVASMALCFGAGTLAVLLTRGPELEIYRREGLAVVGLGWLLSGAFGALPYMLSDTLPAFHDAWFETLSGLTTTGSTVLTDIESVAPSILFWRSLSHWLGGMGVIVLFLAVLPSLGAGGKQLFKSEVPGPVPEGLRPTIRETASLLWRIYLGLTLAETLLLMLAGLSFYDALVHTFGTMATGGFSTLNKSIAGYDSVAVEAIIIAFMVLAGTNFTLFYRMLRGERWAIFKDTEWRVYAMILLAAAAFVTAHIYMAGPSEGDVLAAPVRGDLGEAARQASFQVVSVMTTTGYATANFELWPVATKVLLVLLMFVGGSAGSTAGGMKVMRLILLAKSVWHLIRQAYAPHVVRNVRVGGVVIGDDVQKATLGYFVILLLLFGLGTFLVALTGPDITTSTTAVIATLNNIGPGLARVGAIENFAFFAPFAKVVMSVLMVLGRLELFAILALFAPSLWRRR